MASVTKTPQGGWKVRWRVGQQARSKTFDTRAQADAFRVGIDSDLLSGRAVVHNRVTLDQWARTWMPNRQGLRETTTARNLSLYSNHIRPALGDTFLSDLTPPMVQAFVSALAKKQRAGKSGKTLAPTTVREVYQELDKCLTAAVHAKYLRDNPCQGISLPKVEHQDMHFLTHGQVKALAETIDARYRALVYLLAYGGLRIGEATALLPTDFDGQSVSVTKTVSEVRGQMLTNTPKTRAGRRTVPLPAFVCEEVSNHLSTYPGDYLFTGANGGQVRANILRARHFRKAKEAVGMPGLRIHDLRHTAVSLWINQGVDLLRIKKWAGHTSATFTLDRYGHLFEDENDAIMLRLNQGITTAHDS